MKEEEILIALFVYNRDAELHTMLSSMRQHASGFDAIVYDDGSTNAETHKLLEQNQDLFTEVFKQPIQTKTKTRGRLAENIQRAYEYASENNYKYLFLVQDDMQFVRTFSQEIRDEYASYFTKDNSVIQVDPRFLRRLGKIEVNQDFGGYLFSEKDFRRSYADVGILSIERMNTLAWSFEQTERENKVKASNLGCKRIFPYRPLMMHVPYPTIYRKGKLKSKFPSPFVSRGNVRFRDLTKVEIVQIDQRPLSVIPYAKDFLTVERLGFARLHYTYAKENKIFA